jgi:hypothetical protein
MIVLPIKNNHRSVQAILLKRVGHRESLQTAFNLPPWGCYEKRNNKVPVLLQREPVWSLSALAVIQPSNMEPFQWLALLIGIVLLAIAFFIFAISQSFILTVVIYFASAISLRFYLRKKFAHRAVFTHKS